VRCGKSRRVASNGASGRLLSRIAGSMTSAVARLFLSVATAPRLGEPAAETSGQKTAGPATRPPTRFPALGRPCGLGRPLDHTSLPCLLLPVHTAGRLAVEVVASLGPIVAGRSSYLPAAAAKAASTR
jgi:hypothetical protein